MTGDEHFAEAERLLVHTESLIYPSESEIAQAQVHATLALAAFIKPPRGPRSNQGFG